MPQIVLAATQAAALAPVVAPAVLAPAAAGIGTAAANTAALELAKQKAIETSMQQMATQGAKQATAEAVKQQVGQQVANQGLTQAGTEATKQVGAESLKQGLGQAAQPLPPAGPPGGTPFTPPTTPPPPAQPLPPAGNTPPVSPADIAAGEAEKQLIRENTAREFAARGNQVKGVGYQTAGNNTSLVEKAAADPSLTQGQFNGLKVSPDKAFGPDSSGIYKGFDPATNMPYETFSSPTFKPPTGDGTGVRVPTKIAETFGQPAKQSALEKGFHDAMKFVGENKINTGLGLMAAGQYMNRPEYEEEDKDKYKSTVDMSGFQPSIPKQPSFTRSYEYQNYAVGGPVEQMSAQNAIGANTGYPMANLQTPMYSDPEMQRPKATNVVAPSADAGVNTYTGEARFASGGLSDAQRREYGLKTRNERAARNLTASYEEMEAERQKEAMKLFGEPSNPGIIRRSRTQELSSPFSAAMAEHTRLAKKNKVPVIALPKTNLGDIDNYMDTPLDAANGGIMRYASGGETQYGVKSNPNHVNPENKIRAELAGGRRPAPAAPVRGAGPVAAP